MSFLSELIKHKSFLIWHKSFPRCYMSNRMTYRYKHITRSVKISGFNESGRRSGRGQNNKFMYRKIEKNEILKECRLFIEGNRNRQQLLFIDSTVNEERVRNIFSRYFFSSILFSFDMSVACSLHSTLHIFTLHIFWE